MNSLNLESFAVRLRISVDGSTLWVSTTKGRVLRIEGIRNLILEDDRRK